jgi:asparagine synthase (glutamine-hydrolysing)
MCGIVGATGHAITEEQLHIAIRSLRHRGPDGRGTFIDSDSSVALGHARLSIIDLETGAQPLYSENDAIVLVCNGEIYDFERIRDELTALGHVFQTKSDSEVIIHLYQQHGPDFFKHLRGEFAFLLYDREKAVLLAVRDRFGIKPLFFNEQNGNFLFASEAKAMFASGLLKPQMCIESVRDYFSGVIPDSMFEGVQIIPPGCYLTVDLTNRTHTTQRYWDCDFPPENARDDVTDVTQCIAMVRETFDEAVRFRLRSDVPVGVYLSGGIDSAIVAATVARYHNEKVKAFNISFPDDEAFDEFALSREMANKIGAEFHSIECGREAMLENMEDCIWITELPFPNFHGVGKFMLSKLAREHVTVVLTGEGSDEVFLGYIFFQPGKGAMSDQMQDKLKEAKIPKQGKVRKIVDALGFVPMPEHVRSLTNAAQAQIRRLFHKFHSARLEKSHPLDSLKRRIDRNQTAGRPLARQMQYAWIRTMLAPYLLTILGDRAEMSHSIEGRTPFLDHHLVEKARHIPDRFKIRDGVEKYVLREAFKDRLTESIYTRKKWPYTAPPLWIAKGQSAKLDALLDKYLSRGAIERSGIFNFRALRLIQWVSKAIFFDCGIKRAVNVVLLLFLTVQILDSQYVQEFESILSANMLEK